MSTANPLGNRELMTAIEDLKGLNAASQKVILANKTAVAAADVKITTVDTVVDAIKLKTDNLPASPASTLDQGTEFFISKVVSQAAIVAAGADLTGVVTVGGVEILDVIIQVDSTAIDSAGHGAVVEIYSDGTYGSSSFFTMAQAKGVANANIDGHNATAFSKTVVGIGSKIGIKATTEDVTSAGNILVYLHCKRAWTGATLAAA